jgi:hypothetical protein
MNVKLVHSDPGRPNLDLVGSFVFMVYTCKLFLFQHHAFGWKVITYGHSALAGRQLVTGLRRLSDIHLFNDFSCTGNKD